MRMRSDGLLSRSRGERRDEEDVIALVGRDLLGEERWLLDREAVDLAGVGILRGRVLTAAAGGGSSASRIAELGLGSRDLRGATGFGGAQQLLVCGLDGVVECLQRLLLLFVSLLGAVLRGAAGALALSGRPLAVGGAVGGCPVAVRGALVTDLRSDQGPDRYRDHGDQRAEEREARSRSTFG